MLSQSNESNALLAPTDQRFFRWYIKRSKYIGCLETFAVEYRKKYKEFYSKRSKVPSSIIKKVIEFRDWSVEHSMTPLLFSGTLLGK